MSVLLSVLLAWFAVSIVVGALFALVVTRLKAAPAPPPPTLTVVAAAPADEAVLAAVG